MNGKSAAVRPAAAGERGATLMVVLVMIVVVGLGAGMVGSTWKTIVQQSREEELLFRGDQYRRAIESYLSRSHGNAPGAYPARLEDLLRDPRTPGTVRHLRRLYKEPMTGGEWELIRDPGGRITGVRSSSTNTPFRRDSFSAEYEHFRGAEKYRDWEFIARPQQQVPARQAGRPAGESPAPEQEKGAK